MDEETMKLIERLLLRGERLLNETCPVCGTPLILIKRLGLRFCPKCKRYVIRSEEEYKKARSLGIKPGDMIIVGFRPQDLKQESFEQPTREDSFEQVREIRKPQRPEEIAFLLREVVKLVKEGRYDEAYRVAEIIKLLCSCFS